MTQPSTAENIRVVLRLKDDGLSEEDKEDMLHIDTETLDSRPSSTTASDVFSRLAAHHVRNNYQLHYDEKANPKRISCGKHVFEFDDILSSDCKQEKVFERVVEPLLHHALNGYNVSVFAYGQSNSGKTYTIYGEEHNEGIVTRAILFLSQQTEIVSMQMAHVELYNEELFDLDFPEPDATVKVTAPLLGKGKKIKTYASESTKVNDFCYRPVSSWNELLTRVQRNCGRRTVDSTMLNERSTRAHTILALRLDVRKEKDLTRILMPEICLVDLCGSEDVRRSMVTGDKLEDTIYINQSLSTLTTVVAQLTSNTFPSYRSSMLTHKLRNSLGGSAKTCFIICCSQLPKNAVESHNSIQFGSRLKKIKNSVTINEKLSYDEAIQRMNAYKTKVAFLTNENQRLRELLAKNSIELPKELRNTGVDFIPMIASAQSSVRTESTIPQPSNRRSISLQAVTHQIEIAARQEGLIQSAMNADVQTDEIPERGTVDVDTVTTTTTNGNGVERKHDKKYDRAAAQAAFACVALSSKELEEKLQNSLRVKKRGPRNGKSILEQAFHSLTDNGTSPEHEVSEIPKDHRNDGADKTQKTAWTRNGVRCKELTNRLLRTLLKRIAEASASLP